jgi:catechol 2,3-dioxygenase-like lactoylglutathione lyase family enzyme
MIRKIVATELIVRDLAACTAFYRDMLGLEVSDSGPEFAMFKVGDLYFFLQGAAGAARMMSEEPLELSSPGPSRVLLAASVGDVDAMYADLKAKGVRVLRPPTDQAWGLRTAYFTDPEGNFWEIHQPVASEQAG